MVFAMLIFQPPVRRQMKAKQASVQPYGVTSSTARRILQSLEKMSSPLAVNHPPSDPFHVTCLRNMLSGAGIRDLA